MADFHPIRRPLPSIRHSCFVNRHFRTTCLALLLAVLPVAAQDAASLSSRPFRLTARADGGLVWEAEWANRLTGSWDCLPMKGAGGDAVLWAREGTGRRSTVPVLPRTKGPAVPVDSPIDAGTAIYILQIPREGEYRLWMRVRPEDGCGDSCLVRFDLGEAERFPGHAHGRYPFAIPGDFNRWVWICDAGRRDRLTAGPHLLRVDVREDGFAIDQMALLPEGAATPDGTTPLGPTCIPSAARRPSWVAEMLMRPGSPGDDVPLIDCALAMESRVLASASAPAANGWLWLRSNSDERLTLDIRLESDTQLLTPGEWSQAVLTPDAPVLRVPVRVAYAATSPLAGHRLKASVTLAKPAAKTGASTVLFRPLDWRAVGPVTPARDSAVATAMKATNWLDVTQPPVRGGGERWRRVTAPEHYWCTGTIDLTRLFDGECAYGSAWFVTRIDVRRTGTYTLIAGADDAMDLWCDEALLLSTAAHLPLTDTLRRYTVKLEAGSHQLLARIGQQTGAWLFHLEFRDADDGPATGIAGMPLP